MLAVTKRAVGQHDVGFEQVVDREAVLAREVAGAAAERQARDAGASRRCRTGTARPNGCVAWSTSPDVQPGSTRTVFVAGSTRTPFIIGQVDHEAVVAAAKPGAVVAAAADRDEKAMFAPEVHGGDHVGDIDAARNQARPLVDHPVVERARLVVAVVAGLE